MPMEELMLSVSAIGLVLMLMVCRKLASAHATKWSELGGSFWHLFRLHGFWRFFRFLFSSEPRALQDGTLLAQVWALRVVLVAATVALISTPFRAA